MILCLDVGNSQIYGGVFDDTQKLLLQFRKTSQAGSSSDESAIFLRSVLRENGLDPECIDRIAICCVVPDVLYSLRGACTKYFNIEPFVLEAGVKTGLKVKYKNPLEVGSDRIADAVAAAHLYPNKNLIIVDFGTATTVCAVSSKREFLGGNIIAGVRLSMEALEAKAAKLPSVEIRRPGTSVGKTTIESIQSGLYWSNVGTIRELTNQISKEVFDGEKPMVIGTGGFAHLFDQEDLFDEVIPDLILKGLYLALNLNQPQSARGVKHKSVLSC
jgi:type III pantothenate kinase